MNDIIGPAPPNKILTDKNTNNNSLKQVILSRTSEEEIFGYLMKKYYPNQELRIDHKTQKGRRKSMKTLPLNLRKNNFNYTKVLRGERSSIYEQRVDENTAYYEVFLNKVRSERKLEGKVLEAKEMFPNDEAFGVWAWTFRDYEAVLWRFQELEAEKSRMDFCYPGTIKKIYSS